MSQELQNKTVRVVKYLSYGGLIPFVATLLGIFVFDESLSTLSLQAFIAYAAVILSFVGAVHWGYILTEKPDNAATLLSLSVLPNLTAWVSLLLAQQLTFI